MHYVVVGAGPAGVIAAETLRKADSGGRITLVGDEPDPPYSRMAIPYLLIEKVGEDGTYLRKDENHYRSLGIDIRHDRVTKVDAEAKTLRLAGGDELGFDKLLVATGSTPIKPPIPGVDTPGVHTCWTLEDARQIMALAKPDSRVLLIGAGFIGCIVLEALALRKVALTVVETGDRMVPRMMNETAGGMIKDWCEKKGVEVYTSTSVTEIRPAAAKFSDESTSTSAPADSSAGTGGGIASFFRRLLGGESRARDQADSKPDITLQPGASDQALTVVLSDGSTVEADLVIAAAGVKPNFSFLDGTGVETDRGIKVDRHFQASVSDIYAAGDVAQGRDFSTGEFEVHAIQPTASEHGRVAALNMAGKSTEYQGSLNMNVLDTLGLISSSFGQWMGIEGGDSIELSDAGNFRYLNLQFDRDVLVGATSLGWTQHVGVLRGLIQGKTPLGKWKERLKADPTRIMEAYLDCNHAYR